MSDREIEALAPELRALLQAERERAPVPAETSARLAQRIAGTLALPPLGGGGGGDAGGGSTAAPATPGVGRNALLRLFAGARAVPVVCAFIAGGAAGAVVTAKVMRAPAQVTVAAAPAIDGAETPHAAVPVASAGTPASVVPVAGPGIDPPRQAELAPPVSAIGSRAAGDAGVAKPGASPRARVDQDRDLTVEREMIELARSALAHNRPGDALAAMEGHARRFRHGRLVEERESLRVAALAALGRNAEARAAAAAFHRRYPNSLFGAGVDELLRSLAHE